MHRQSARKKGDELLEKHPRMRKLQYDVLIYHHEEDEDLAHRFKTIISQLSSEVGEEVKVASTAELAAGATIFQSMQDALDRCSWMFILITENFLKDSETKFLGQQALMDSIKKHGSEKYVPVYKDRKASETIDVPSYVRILTPVYIGSIEGSPFRRTGLVETIKKKLEARKVREQEEHRRVEREKVVADFKRRRDDIRAKYEQKKSQLKGTVELQHLRQSCASEILHLAKDNEISDLSSFLISNDIDVSFATDDVSRLSDESLSYEVISESLSMQESGQGHPQMNPLPSAGHRNPVEHDEAVENDEMEEATAGDAVYEAQTTRQLRRDDSEPNMSELKEFASLSREEGGRGSPLIVPPCPQELEPPPLIPAVLDDLQSSTSFISVPRISGQYDQDVGSMVAECSESSIHDGTSLLGSQSHANLADLDEENMSQFSRDSADSNTGEDMDVGDTAQVDLSLLETATGRQPLPLDTLPRLKDVDDESMVVEVDSTIDEIADDSIMGDSSVAVTPNPDPPMRIMHRSFHANDEEDFDEVQPLEVDVNGELVGGAGPSSPGLGSLVANSWPRHRRGSDAGARRTWRSNLTTNKFLSLSSVQSLTSKLFKLHYNPSLNDISEWNDQPKPKEGIRLKYSW